jgi:hypothetical protein
MSLPPENPHQKPQLLQLIISHIPVHPMRIIIVGEVPAPGGHDFPGGVLDHDLEGCDLGHPRCDHQ